MNSCDEEDDTIGEETRALYARGIVPHCTVVYCSSLYCCSLWSACDYATTLRGIHVVHSDAFRFMFHLPQYTRVSNIFVSHDITSFSDIPFAPRHRVS